jgi:glucokinase
LDKKYIVGIDLGGTKITGAISDIEGRVLYSTTVMTLAHEGCEPVVGRIKGVIRSLLDHEGIKSCEVRGIGIGSPGPLNSRDGVILGAYNIPGFVNLPIVSLIEDEFKVCTFLENDANAAAIGELWFGAGRGCRNFVYVTVSTGIGGGIIIDGDIYTGNTSNAGEIGHITMDPEGPLCTCGNTGCLEAFSSGTAIGRIANERLAANGDSILKEYDKVTSIEVFEAASKGDRLAGEVIDYCMGYLGVGIASIVNFLDPEVVIIGGGVSKAGPAVFDRVRRIVEERCLKAIGQKVKIVPAGLGTDAGVVGAIGIVITKIRNGQL